MISRKYPPVLRVEDISNAQCKHLFRFEKGGWNDLRCMMEIPQVSMRLSQFGMEGLCVVIRRQAYQNRVDDLTPLFGRTKYELSNTFNTSLDYVYDNYSYLVDTLNRPWFLHESLQVMATAIQNKNSSLENCWGFYWRNCASNMSPGTNGSMALNGIIGHFKDQWRGDDTMLVY